MTLDDAQELYAEYMSAHSSQRTQIEEDLRFSDPSNPDQWDEDIKNQRLNDPGGARPCLTFDQTGQYVANVAGQIEKSPPSLHAIPVGGDADKLAAEQIDGRFRHIEYMSKAAQHYTRGLTAAARTGVGYLIVRPTYVNKEMGFQEPRIFSESDALKVVFDPWSLATDGSDATDVFLLTDVAERIFNRRWPGKTFSSFGDTGSHKQDERKTALIAEHWSKNGDEVSWMLMSGDDILEKTVYPASFIGIVPIYGYLGFANGRMRFCGIPRRARNPQQTYNYHLSEEQAYIATAPKSPWLASKRAIEGVEELWDKAAVETRAVLTFNDWDENGAIAQPNRINIATNLINHQSGAQQALKDIQAAIGMYQANLGAPSNETSGVAIENRKMQGEASVAHFPAHMAASLGHVGTIVMEMDSRLTDAKRKQTTIGVDGSIGSITIDPEQQTAFRRDQSGATINPRIGQYGVRVVVGPSYATQRSQTNAAFGEIMRSNKELAPIVAPFWAQTLDIPGSDKLSQALAAMAPPPVKAILAPEGENKPDPAVLMQQMDELQQALQEALQHAQDAQQDADKAMRELGMEKAKNQDKDEALEIDKYNAETNRLKVTGANEEQIQVIVKDLINDMLTSETHLPGDMNGVASPMSGNAGMNPAQETPPVDEVVSPPAPVEPPPPSQEMLALLESQKTLIESMETLSKISAMPRSRKPVRDKNGNILEVVDSIKTE